MHFREGAFRAGTYLKILYSQQTKINVADCMYALLVSDATLGAMMIAVYVIAVDTEGNDALDSTLSVCVGT